MKCPVCECTTDRSGWCETCGEYVQLPMSGTGDAPQAEQGSAVQCVVYRGTSLTALEKSQIAANLATVAEFAWEHNAPMAIKDRCSALRLQSIALAEQAAKESQ